jgi:uncharacterized protein (DUF1330 family)
MPAHVIVLATPRSDRSEGAAKYSQAVQPLLAAAGAKAVFRGPVTQTVAGGESATTGLVLEFPDADAAASFFAQDAYMALVPLRDESFARIEIHIVG